MDVFPGQYIQAFIIDVYNLSKFFDVIIILHIQNFLSECLLICPVHICMWLLTENKSNIECGQFY